MAYCKCGNNAFQVSKQNVQFDEKRSVKVKFIVCSNPKCQQVVGVLPDKISKTKLIKVPTQSKIVNPTNVETKPKGAIISGVELVNQNIKSKKTVPDFANNAPAQKISTISSVAMNQPNIGISKANLKTNTSPSLTSINENKPSKSKK
jgi:hypothetical protein